MREDEDSNELGVSPALSVVLIVAIVVSLTALVAVASFSLVDTNNTESPDASFTLDIQGNQVQAVVLRNENVEGFTLVKDDDSVNVGSSAGSIADLPLEQGTYMLKAKTDGSDSEQVVETLRVTSSQIESNTISGSVNINPPIPGAKIDIINQDTGSVINTTTTDSNGEFEKIVPEGEYKVRVNATDVSIQIDGSNENFYGGIWEQNVHRGDTLNINFDEQNSVECQVNGKDALVAYGQNPNGDYQISNRYQTHCIDDMGIDGQYTLGSNIADTTGNGLSDYRQTEILGSDPTVTNSDDDGISDKFEVHQLDTDPNSNKTVKDGFRDDEAYNRDDLVANQSNILVEVSYMDHQDIDISSVDFDALEQKFNESGYNIAFDVDDSSVSYTDNITLYGDYTDNYYNDSTIYTRQSDGYLHLLIADTIGYSGLEGVTTSDPNFMDGMLVEYSSEDNMTEHFIMHEIGHQLGLITGPVSGGIVDSGDVYSGIDSQEASCSDYNSVMNYNCQPNTSDFLESGFSGSSSTYNDKSIIDKYKSDTNPINTEELCFESGYTCEP